MQRPSQPSFHRDDASSTVMGAVVFGFASFLQQQGVAVDTIFERSSIHPDVLLQPNQPISLRSFLNAIEIGVRVTGNEDFGLWFGNQYRPEFLGLLGYLALSSATLGDALQNMAKYLPVFQSKSEFSLRTVQGKVHMEYRLVDGSIVNRRHDAEMTLGIILNIMRRALGERWSPLEVKFCHSLSGSWKGHLKAFQSEVRFGQTTNAIVFNREELARPMLGADPQLLRLTMEHFDFLKLSSAVRVSVSDRVLSEIIDVIPAGLPRLETIADRLSLPTWTLSRQLRYEGTKFSDLVDGARKQLSCFYLQHSSLSISQLASTLGYCEVSSFTHAFTRWFEMPPKKWRERFRGCESQDDAR